MVNQQLLTIFIAVTAVAVLIQTGIAVGLLFASLKMNRQADRAAAEARKYSGRVHDLMDKVEAAANRLAQLSASSRTQLHQLEFQLDRSVQRLQRKLG
jgi:hypothetical protein